MHLGYFLVTRGTGRSPPAIVLDVENRRVVAIFDLTRSAFVQSGRSVVDPEQAVHILADASAPDALIPQPTL
jgi:hypothetical protein